MVDVKSLLSPKVIFPVVGICVLVVVAALVAIFYVRNPTVTDNLFISGDTTGTPDEAEKKTTGSPSGYTGNNGTVSSFSSDQNQTRPAAAAAHDSKAAAHETTSLLSTLAATTTSSTTPEPRPIEPVKHQ